MKSKYFGLVALLCAGFFVWCGHDYWLSGNKLWLQRGEVLNLKLLVGDDLMPEAERSFAKTKTPVFKLHSAKSIVDLLVVATDSVMPVLSRRLETNGPILVEMGRSFSYITLKDSAFTKYLEHEQLAHVTALREQIGKRSQEKERYARNLKCLAQVGAPKPTDDLHGRVLGQELEIVLMQNPYLLKPNSSISAQLLYKGKPLANHPLFALHRVGPNDFVEIIHNTNDRGKATFTLTKPGLWVVRTVHLFPCTGCTDANWESQWAAYTFELPAGKKP